MSNIETPFPGGTYRITREENLALCDAIGAEPDPSGRAHPIFYYIATQVGMGLTVAELCERCDFDVADGPMITHRITSYNVCYTKLLRTCNRNWPLPNERSVEYRGPK